MKPKIGIYVVGFPRSSETFIVTKVLGLLAQGFDITIFSQSLTGDWHQFGILDRRNDVRQRIVYGPTRHRPYASAVAFLLMLLQKLIKHPSQTINFLTTTWRNRHAMPLPVQTVLFQSLMFIGHHIDILHIEFDVQGFGIIGIKDLLGCKILLSSRGDPRRAGITQKYPQGMNYLFQKTDGYHFISEYLYRSTRDAGLPEAVRHWLIQPAIDLTLFTAKSRENGRSGEETHPLTIISVGRLSWEKGYEFALDAIALLRERGLHFKYLILGDGPYKEAITFAARQHHLLEDGTVELLGRVSREQVVKYYADANLMLHAALSEGFCNAIVEAQAMGLPIVTSDAGGLPENIEDNVTGFVVPSRNPKAMAEKLALLLGDAQLRHQMGKAGHERALKLYDIDAQIAAFARLYTELATL